MTAILGLNAFHGDAAAALVIDGELVNAVEEERLNRVKHCAGFPELAVRWCLEDARLDPRELDHVAIGRDPRANIGAKVVRTILNRPSPRYVLERFRNATKVRDVRTQMAEALGVEPDGLRASFHNVEHHLAHAASAFFVSPFDEAAVLTLDGFGDFASAMLCHGRDNRLEVLERVLFPHSLGIFYTAVTQWLGFPRYGDEGKVMGLAPYGDPERHLATMRELVKLDGDGFELELDFFVHHKEGVDMTWDEQTPTIGRLFSERMETVFGPAREPRTELKQEHMDVAAALQAMLEEAYLHLVRLAYRRTGSRNLCLAGGVALNAVANGRIRPETEFDGVYVQPAAGDSGIAVGAAFYVWNQVLGNPRSFVMEHAYTGPEYTEAEAEQAIRAAGFEPERMEDAQLFDHVAERIAEGDVVGWFQGRMEFGPRALGNRSIVVDPRRHDMKDILNARIKHREHFRPFAPSILAEAAGEWFEQDYTSPFMVLVYKTRAERRGEIPAVNHIDDTGRLQTVEERVSPRYYGLIKAFGERTGVPIVLNTSFNENEPIVMTPEHAVETFGKTKMDLLVLGNLVVRRG